MEHLISRLLELLPEDGSSIGNKRLRKMLGAGVSEAEFEQAKAELVAQGLAVKGRGRGGSLKRALTDEGDFGLESQAAPEKGQVAPRKKAGKKKAARRKKGERADVLAYQHDQRRVNNPEVGMVDPDTDPDEGKTRWAYDPHIDPALQFDVTRSQIEKIIDDALTSGDDATMREALATLKRMAEPYLNWTGKAERASFEVDTVSLHVHERINPVTILTNIRKRMKQDDGSQKSQSDMFKAWFEESLPYREAIEFYKHDRGWANRLIAGDSLLVMNSLLQKEGMAGQVQMIYIDPPYGIKYGSNFQPFVNKRDVKDRKDEDLTQEPEMIKAFRDTWELGIHSYLTYLRDRLLLAKELLHESGSVFVQISDENLHHARELMDEIFGVENFVSLVSYVTTSGFPSNTLSRAGDYILWYSKKLTAIKYRALFKSKELGDESAAEYKWALLPDGRTRTLTPDEAENKVALPIGARIWRYGPLTSSGSSDLGSRPVSFFGKRFEVTGNNHWKVTTSGLDRLSRAGRLISRQNSLSYFLFADSYPVQPLNNNWVDTKWGFDAGDKAFVVQTNQKILERCLLMVTDPGDMVLDPTCGSGTTAYVAEKWGRRWITCDTSRVAVTLAKQRLMTASYDYYELKYPHEGLKGGFIYKTVPHVTLKAIANNPDIDTIWERMHPMIESALANLNKALRASPSDTFKVTEGGRKGFDVDFSADASKAMELPSGESAPAGALLGWEVPFDFPEEWPKSAQSAFDAFHAARQAMQRKMDDSIAAHADQEILYDQPEVAKDKLRVTGPFTVEAVPFPTVVSLEHAEQPPEADGSVARTGESARQHTWRDELLKTGIRGKGGQKLEFAELETLPSIHLHCSGTLKDSGDRVVVSFGPEYGALEQRQVELAIREAGTLFPRPKMIVFCSFAFDPEAAKDIDATKGIVALKSQMNTDLLTEDLKKNRSSNESFWLMGQPDVEVRKRKDGKYEVEVNGFDYFETKSGTLVSGGKSKIAAWSLDTDYDERSLFPSQVFFPMAGAKDGWNKLKKDIRAELDERLLDKLHGTVSLPFEAGEYKRVAVKIVDDRGIESLKVIPLE